MQQPDQRTGHGVVLAPVHDLDGEHVEGPDQQDQQDHVENFVQHAGAGVLHQVPVTGGRCGPALGARAAW